MIEYRNRQRIHSDKIKLDSCMITEKRTVWKEKQERERMKDVLKKIKMDVILSAVLCMLLGVVLIIWSAETVSIICMVLAGGLVVMGVVNLIGFFTNHGWNTFSGMLGLILVLVGIWLYMRPEYIAMIIPIVIGVILAVHGLGDIKLGFETKANGYDKWWSVLLLGVISFALGIICIVNAFGVVSLAMKFIGAALIYDGVSDLWIVSRAAKAARHLKQEADALDVEYKEVDDEDQ